MSVFSSIILRFRDLSTPAGTTTIEEHKKIIAARGYVWWGWWHKQGETVPEQAFRDILTEIGRTGGYVIYLFDSGKYKLNRARIVDIRWDNKLTPIATPERDATPNYYGDAHYLAWFKLDLIEDTALTHADLQAWSYARVDEFFETKKSIFDAFYDKQLTSFTELRNQDRTIWFIRPKNISDAVHEIHVYDRSKTAPSNFPEQVIQLHSPALLWVSDPHFSDSNHDFSRGPGLSRTNLSEAIRRDLEHMGKQSIGGLLISGDLTWKSAREEYEQAAQFIADVKSWAKLTSSEVLVCPGNHDLAFSSEPWEKGTPAIETSEQAAFEYKRFYEELYEVKPNAYLSSGRRFLVPNGGLVDVASLNSNVLQQFAGAFQGQGFLGMPQLDDTASALRWSMDRSRAKAFRLCMLHHHVVPILHREHPHLGVAASVVHDAGALMRWLVENEVDLVLHGHMHSPALVKERRALDYPKQENWHEITIAALGSSGVNASHRPNVPNSYGLIEFLRDGARLTVRNISSDDAIHHDQRMVYSAIVPYRQV
ncbi:MULTISPECIES: metallophosphoesterase [unclassified Bradyrhizobium]|uniref:metallophosphoesterase family protein n=1 Tax=unclassified Bradyrhizobium TaxID=2631580 RepID=UPI0029166962|nr:MULTISPECIES: metallophosphoesterase [unclassified Bradyrhizobium]